MLTWVNIVYHHSGAARDFQLESPHVRLGVLPSQIHQGDAGQEQDLFLSGDGTQWLYVDPQGIDARVRVGVLLRIKVRVQVLVRVGSS